MGKIIYYLSLLLLIQISALAEESLPTELAQPVEVARLAFEAGEYNKVIDSLKGYTGRDHPLRHLFMGHAYSRLEKFEDAVSAYQEALAMDSQYRAAGIALAQAYSRLDKWDDVLRTCGKFIDPEKCTADEIVFYAQASYHKRDMRLCSMLTRRAMERFPVDKRLRKLDLVLLLENESWHESAASAMELLADSPGDADLWQNLSHAQMELKHDSMACAATEASWLLNPDDFELLRRHISAQLAVGHLGTVLILGENLLASKGASKVLSDENIMPLFMRAADSATDENKLQKWYAMLKPGQLTDEIVICKARSDLRMGNRENARRALDLLIKKSGTDAAVFVWAGSLAEESGAMSEAEALYRQAKSMDKSASRLASLRLARLLWELKRVDEARAIIADYLDHFPEDTAARSMSLIFKKNNLAGL